VNKYSRQIAGTTRSTYGAYKRAKRKFTVRVKHFVRTPIGVVVAASLAIALAFVVVTKGGNTISALGTLSSRADSVAKPGAPDCNATDACDAMTAWFEALPEASPHASPQEQEAAVTALVKQTAGNISGAVDNNTYANLLSSVSEDPLCVQKQMWPVATLLAGQMLANGEVQDASTAASITASQLVKKAGAGVAGGQLAGFVVRSVVDEAEKAVVGTFSLGATTKTYDALTAVATECWSAT
jgi:hypothetical protein